jgi:hypothetical protein
MGKGKARKGPINPTRLKRPKRSKKAKKAQTRATPPKMASGGQIVKKGCFWGFRGTKISKNNGSRRTGCTFYADSYGKTRFLILEPLFFGG